MNKIIFSVLIPALITDLVMAAPTISCISCTDTSTGQCTSYGSDCCTPCKISLGDTGGDSSFSPSECAKNCPSLSWVQLPDYGNGIQPANAEYWQAMCGYTGQISNLKGTCYFRCIAGQYGTITSRYTTDGKTSYMAENNCQKCPYSGITHKPQQFGFGSKPGFGDGWTIVTAETDPSTSAPDNNTVITNCYIPSGSYGDTTGKFTLTDNCYYKN
ncbi:MAG: hypothetical protein NC548_61905 [Lachnospiraceae bacterium]|nr:hypothetical protein [Lachnospiraceae bacterium]